VISIDTEEQSQPPFMSRVYSARRNKTSKLQFPVNGVEECRTILFVFVIMCNLTKYIYYISRVAYLQLSRHATEEGRFNNK